MKDFGVNMMLDQKIPSAHEYNTFQIISNYRLLLSENNNHDNNNQSDDVDDCYLLRINLPTMYKIPAKASSYYVIKLDLKSTDISDNIIKNFINLQSLNLMWNYNISDNTVKKFTKLTNSIVRYIIVPHKIQ